ncbi:MAG: peptidyl-prolyl cis-trans isomerase [Lachnospiraceae bacterium]|nr:peptidyl-prolyl cis-trans isomerase [Lachnospiraceae bacterium]
MTKKFLATCVSASLAASMLFTGCGSDKLDSSASLVTVGSETIVDLGYGNFAAKFNQAVYDQIYVSYFGSVMWDQEMGEEGTMEDSVKKQILDDLETYYVSGLHAADYDVALTEEQESSIAEAAKTFMEKNTEEALTQMGATEEYAVRYMKEQTVANMLRKKVEAEAEVSISDEEAIQSSISYVLYESTKTDDSGNSVDLSKDELVALRTSATALATADDFDAEAENQGVTVSTYSFTKAADASEDTTLGETVIAEAKKLSNGQTSPVIEVEGKGLYVVRMDSVEDDEATATKRENLEKDARSSYYNDKLKEWKDAIDWKVDDKQWSKVTFKKYFTSVETTDETTSEE